MEANSESHRNLKDHCVFYPLMKYNVTLKCATGSGDNPCKSISGFGTGRGDCESYILGKKRKELTLSIPDLE